MALSKRLAQVLKSSKEIGFDNSSKIIIMSDCHRGNGSLGDDFYKNRNIFLTALRYYFNNKYTYIELGDGDELWENTDLRKIVTTHSNVFKLMATFYKKKRLHMLFGNHDIVKKDDKIKNNILYNYFDKRKRKYIMLFPKIDISEGLILKYLKTGDKILLIHGHQSDFFNDKTWKISRLLVRYLWRPLELIGVFDPTSASINDKKKGCIEKKLIAWTIENKYMLITGHTHKTMFPQPGDHLYFNDGCCIYPYYITGIEINNGSILLVKWSIRNKDDQEVSVDREILQGPIKLKNYFDSIKLLK